MFLRCKVRRKDGKQHRYWSVVENTRVAGGRIVQRHVLYLGEINDSNGLTDPAMLPNVWVAKHARARTRQCAKRGGIAEVPVTLRWFRRIDRWTTARASIGARLHCGRHRVIMKPSI